MAEAQTSSTESLITAAQNFSLQLIDYLPRLAVAIGALVIGWLLARLVRLLIVRTVGRADQLWQRYVVKRGSSQLQPRHPPARVVGELVFWLMMILFVTLAAEILGLGVFVTWLKQIVAYLPLAVAGLLIVLVGFVVSSLARDLIGTAAASAGLTHGDLLGRAAQMVILAVAVIIGIDQIGIDIGFLSVVAGIVLASMLGGIALAFGLGARTHVSNIIAANQLRGRYRVGDRIRIGEIEGQIAEIAVARLTVETETGTVDIPAKLFDEQVSVLTDRGA